MNSVHTKLHPRYCMYNWKQNLTVSSTRTVLCMYICLRLYQQIFFAPIQLKTCMKNSFCVYIKLTPTFNPISEATWIWTTVGAGITWWWTAAWWTWWGTAGRVRWRIRYARRSTKTMRSASGNRSIWSYGSVRATRSNGKAARFAHLQLGWGCCWRKWVVSQQTIYYVFTKHIYLFQMDCNGKIFLDLVLIWTKTFVMKILLHFSDN